MYPTARLLRVDCKEGGDRDRSSTMYLSARRGVKFAGKVLYYHLGDLVRRGFWFESSETCASGEKEKEEKRG